MEPPPANKDFAVSDASKYRIATSRQVEAKLASAFSSKNFALIQIFESMQRSALFHFRTRSLLN
jgi:hypothetical protein